jgi:predicted dehydrogenase
MEKPVAADAPGVRRVLAANKIAKEKNLAVQVGLQRHHESGYKAIIEKCQEGAIGDIVFARAYWNSNGVWVRNRKPEQTELEYQMYNWYYFNWLSGDHITEQHIHNLDVINWLMDDFPATAQGQGGREVRTFADTGEIFDHHFVEFTYGNANKTKLLSQCRHIENCWSAVSEYAHGTKGWADLSGGMIYDLAGNQVWSAPKNENGWAEEHVDLFAAIRNGERPNEGDYGAKSTMTSIMGRMATYSGKELTWDECLNSDVSLADYDSLTSFDVDAPVQPIEPGVYKTPTPGTDKSQYV